MTNQNRPTIKSRNTGLITGTKKRFTALSTITLNGKPYTPNDIITVLQTEMDAADAVVPARGTWRAKVAAAKAATLNADEILPFYEQFIRQQFGDDAEALGDFSMAPKPPRNVPVATKAAAAQKATATKAASAQAVKTAKAQAATTAPEPASPATPATPATPAGTPSKS
jgi:hypothetical protein